MIMITASAPAIKSTVLVAFFSILDRPSGLLRSWQAALELLRAQGQPALVGSEMQSAKAG